MSRFLFDITCPKCGRDIEHEAQGAPAIFETRAVCRCHKCNLQLVVNVSIGTTLPRFGLSDDEQDRSALGAPLIASLMAASA